MKIGRVKKNLGMWKILLAAVFLFNPNFVIVDPLPDFIGYAFLMWGIYQLSDLNYHFEEAMRGFKKLVIVSISQLLAVLFVFGFLTYKEQDSALTLFSFTFGVIEIVFLLPAFKAFFEGFVYLGSRHESTAIFKVKDGLLTKLIKFIYKKLCALLQKLGPKKEKADTNDASQGQNDFKYKRESAPPKNATEKIKRLTLAFIFIKPALTFAPEVLSLIESPYYVDYSRFVGAFRSLSWMLLVPIGLIWLFKFVLYIRSVMKDKPFINELSAKYTAEITPKTFLFIKRYIKVAFAFLSIAIAFNIDFYIDNSSIIPDFISPVILFGMLILVTRINRRPPIFSTFCVIGYFVISLLTHIENKAFFTEHTLSKTYFVPESYNAFIKLTTMRIVSSALFILMIISILPILSKIIKENTGFAPISNGNFYAEEKIKYIHAILKRRLIIVGILTVLAGASSIAYALLVRSTERVVWLLYIWVLEFVIHLIFIIYFVSTLNNISEEMDHKYMLS